MDDGRQAEEGGSGRGEERKNRSGASPTPWVPAPPLLRSSTPAAAVLPRPVVVSILMPVYNERETIREALRRVRAVPGEKEIIVVDDASTDGTSELLAEEPDIVLIRHADNQGKGAA